MTPPRSTGTCATRTSPAARRPRRDRQSRIKVATVGEFYELAAGGEIVFT